MSTKERSPSDNSGEVESPFLDQELFVAKFEEEWEPRVAALVAESPFPDVAFEELPTSAVVPEVHEEGTEPEAEGVHEKEYEYERHDDAALEWEDPGCAGEQAPPDLEVEGFDSEIWTGSADQIKFRDWVLEEHIARKKKPPLRDLSHEELKTLKKVPGTAISTLPDTAAAAGRLLAAANADLVQAQQAGDADALRTVRLTVNSGHRSSQVQRDLWRQYFSATGGYYDQSQAAREKLPKGPHSKQAVDYMLSPDGFVLAGKIAAPGYSNHQAGIAIDFLQERSKGHGIKNKSDPKSRARWRATWFYDWLTKKGNAEFYGFKPIPTEEWHWEYCPGPWKYCPRASAAAPSGRAASPARVSAPANEQVRFAQRVLNAAEGERLGDDGDLGRLTRAALERFRAKYGLGAGGELDAKTELALAQRALEELAQASRFAQVGQRDATTDQALAGFKSTRGLGIGATLDAATRRALTDALARRAPASGSGAAPASSFLGGKLWTFTAATLPLRVSVFCPTAAISQAEVDLLVYAHGLLDRCEGPHTVPGIITQAPFKLAQIINDAHRAIVLVAPHLNWGNYKDAHPMSEPAKLNGVLAEVLTELGRMQGVAAPTVRNLIIAGHSRAYGVLEPLARAHTDISMQQGALAKLSQVWAFDTTYKGRVDDWMAWLNANPRLAISVFYRPGSTQQRTAGKKLTWAVGDQFYRRKGGRLAVERVPEGHCDVPPTRLPALLARSPSLQQESEGWLDRRELGSDSGLNTAEAYADDPDATEAEFDGEYVAGELSIDDLLDDIPIEPEDEPTEPEAHDDADEAAETAFTSHDEATEEALDDIADKTLDDTLTELDAASTPETELFESAPTGGVFAEDAEISPAAKRCQQEWLTEVAAYPTEVRNAIANAPTHGALDVYLWAVRKGMRDETKLRRLIYFTLYGFQHSYCEPTTSAAKKAWKDVGTVIRAYKKWPQPPRAQTGAEPCPKSGAQRVPPDKPALDITGRYYTLHPPATFVINQAGQHIEGVASYVIDSSSAKSGDHRPVTEFQGDLHRTRYQWFNSYRPSNFGQVAENKGKLFISQGVGANNETVWEQLRPIARIQRSTLIRSGDIDRSFDLIDRHELTPLTPEQMQFIRLILDKDKLDQIFKLYFNGQKRDEAMGFLIRRLVDTPGHASYVARMEKFHEVDLPLVREYARQVLTFQKWKSQRNVIRSHGDWIQMMMDRTMQPRALAASDFKRFFGLNADPQRARSDGEHTYEFTIKLTGASLILAGYTGTVLIEKKTGERTWKRPFDIELWGANAAIDLFDAKIDSELKGAARSYLEWTENDVPGSVRIARVSASIGMDIASTQAGFMHVFGDKSLPPLDVFFQEAKLGVPNINKILEEAAKGKVEQLMKKPGGLSPKGVLGLDVGFSALFGSISPPGSLLERLRKAHKAPDVIDLSRDLKSDVSVMRAFSSQTHFCLDDDRLTEAAVQALRIICARELPSFMSPQSYLSVIGHADTLGRGRYDNESLSKRRAENTIQAIKDVLGGKFNIQNDGIHIRAIAAGDKLAAQESGSKAVAAPKHRRVQIFLNSVLVLTLFGSSSVS